MNSQSQDTSDPVKADPRHADGSSWQRWVRMTCVVVVIICFLAFLKLLPVGNMVHVLEGVVNDLGIWGPVLFILVYIMATVLMVPASALTLAAGVVFGLLGGTVVVSIASTTGAAAAFLISRYLARGMVEKRLINYPKFKAVDRAVSQGGWKIVALLRLSPAVPFNLQNYLYGVTAIRFWPCILTSWVAMLPGTFMYVYLGYAGRAGVAAATGEGAGRSPLQWTMLGVGLLATFAVTVYVTKLAHKAMANQAQSDDQKITAVDDSDQDNKESNVPQKSASPLATSAYVIVALLAVTITGCAYTQKNILKGLFGPPQAKLTETYSDKTDSPDLNHEAFGTLLHQYVNDHGGVDYKGLATQQDVLQTYIKNIAKAPFDKMGRDQKLAYLINAYNAFTLELILQNNTDGKLESIKDIPAAKRWDDVRWQVAGKTVSLNQIEHELIRPNFKEPRIHFALVCAAVGCPPLRSAAYTASKLEQQLDAQARYVHTHPKWFVLNTQDHTVKLTQLYNWYGGDFEQVSGTVLKFASQYNNTLKQWLDNNQPPAVQWLDYDWSLNSQENIK